MFPDLDQNRASVIRYMWMQTWKSFILIYLKNDSLYQTTTDISSFSGNTSGDYTLIKTFWTSCIWILNLHKNSNIKNLICSFVVGRFVLWELFLVMDKKCLSQNVELFLNLLLQTERWCHQSNISCTLCKVKSEWTWIFCWSAVYEPRCISAARQQHQKHNQTKYQRISCFYTM